MFPVVSIPPSYVRQGVTQTQWQDWRWQLAMSARTGREVAERLGSWWGAYLDALPAQFFAQLGDLRLTPYLLSCIDAANAFDPWARQHMPHVAEADPDDFSYDAVWERASDFADGSNRMIQQKYPDIVLLRISNTCHSFCRFCFEKERTLLKKVPTAAGEAELTQALAYIKARPAVRQVLLSGGDPLIVPDALLRRYLEPLSALPQLRTIRLNTRTLTHNPYRLTTDLISLLSDVQARSWHQRDRGVTFEIGVHFNHPAELTPVALAMLRNLGRASIAVYNQTVLLKGINDDARILADLFRQLRSEGVRLHYLSQAMEVPGTSHLRTMVRTGQKIMRELRHLKEFRGQLPHFELSHHTGKQIIPDYMNEFFYEDQEIIHGKSRRIIRFLSDCTGHWEVFRDGEEV